MHRIHSVCFSLVLLLLAASFARAAELTYPDQPIRIINPFPSGSPVDVIGRLIDDRLEKALGQPVLVESKSGAGGTLGANYIAKSPPDGYTLLVTTGSTLATAPALYRSLPYDPIADFAPIWAVKSSGQVVVVNPALPVTSLQELVQYTKAHKGEVSYASSGFGTVQHLAGELFVAHTGAPLTHVPYRGGAPATNDLIGGHIQVMFDAIGNTLQNIQAGKLRALAVLRAQRARAAGCAHRGGSGCAGCRAQRLGRIVCSRGDAARDPRQADRHARRHHDRSGTDQTPDGGRQ